MGLEEQLFSAISQNNIGEVVRILSSKVNVNAKNNDGNTAIHIAILNHNIFMIETLVQQKADVNIRSSLGLTVLSTAVLTGNIEAVETLLRLGVKHDAWNSNGDLPIHLAAQKGYPDIVKILLREDTVCTYNHDGFTSLHLAVLHNHINVVKILIEYYPDCINIDDGCNGNTALILAVQQDNLPIVKLLLKNKADSSRKNKDKKTFNEYAISNGMKLIVSRYEKLLSKLNADPTQSLDPKSLACKRKRHSNTSSSSENSVSRLPISKRKQYMTSSFTPEHSMQKYKTLSDISNTSSPQSEASGYTHEKPSNESSLNSFRSSSYDITIIPNLKNDLFYTVSEGKKEEIIRMLELCVNPNIKSDFGQSLIHIAALCGYSSIVKILVEYGADINIQDNQGNTVLHNIFYTLPNQVNILNEKAIITKLLCENKANLNIQNNDGNTVLFAAIPYGFVEIVKAFIDEGARIDIINKYGLLPIHMAVYHGNLNMVMLLCDYKADINVRNNMGETVLFIAILFDFKHIAKFLLESGVHSDVPNNKGDLPIHLAAKKKGYSSIVKKILITNKDSVNKEDHDGFTPLHLAVKCSDRDSIKILMEYSCAEDIDTAFALATKIGNKQLLEDIVNSKKKNSSESNGYEKPLNDADEDSFNHMFKIWKFGCKRKRSTCSSDSESITTTLSCSTVSAQCSSNSSGKLSNKTFLCNKFISSLDLNEFKYDSKFTNCKKAKTGINIIM